MKMVEETLQVGVDERRFVENAVIRRQTQKADFGSACHWIMVKTFGVDFVFGRRSGCAEVVDVVIIVAVIAVVGDGVVFIGFIETPSFSDFTSSIFMPHSTLNEERKIMRKEKLL